MTKVEAVKTWRDRFKEKGLNPFAPEYIEKSLQAKIQSGEIPEEFLPLLAKWLDTIERLANVGGPSILDPVIVFLVLSKEDRYTFLADYVQEQIDGFERLTLEIQLQKQRLKEVENGK